MKLSFKTFSRFVDDQASLSEVFGQFATSTISAAQAQKNKLQAKTDDKTKQTLRQAQQRKSNTTDPGVEQAADTEAAVATSAVKAKTTVQPNKPTQAVSAYFR